MRGRGQRGGERGQAAAELLAVVPLLLGALLALAQAALAGYALWSAGDAARAGARAQHVGGNPERAALSALPSWLEDGARVEASGAVDVSVGAPALLPGLPEIRVHAGAGLDPVAGDG